MKRFAFTVLLFLLFVSVIPVFADYTEGAEFAGMQVTFIVENGKFDQLIDYGTFLHVSWKRNGANRKQRLIKR